MKKYLFVPFFCCFWTISVQSASLKQTFDVQIGLFDAAKVNVFYQTGKNDYIFETKMTTSGLFDKLYSFKADYRTSGFFQDDSFITTDYHQSTKSSAHLRTKKLIFDSNGILYQRQSSKDDAKKTVDVVLPSSLPDAFDLQTVLIMMIKQFQADSTCNLSKTVFNGKKTYHVRFEDDGATFFKDKNVHFTGQSHKCLAFIHQTNTEKGDLLWQVSAEKPIVFYLVKDAKTGLVFVPKIEIRSTPLGDLKAYMTNLTQGK